MEDELNFDGISEEEANGQIFKQGQSILIETEDSYRAGAFIGLSDFGVIFRATHKMREVEVEVDEDSIVDLIEDLSVKTIAQLKEFAAAQGVTFTGCKVKADYVAALVQHMVDVAREEGPRKEMVELKRTIMTFLPWPEVLGIEATTEWLEEQNLSDFSAELAAFSGLVQDDSAVVQDEPQGSDE